MSFDYSLRYPEIVELLKAGKELTLGYGVDGKLYWGAFYHFTPRKYVRKNLITKLYQEYKFHQVDESEYTFVRVTMCLDPDCKGE